VPQHVPEVVKYEKELMGILLQMKQKKPIKVIFGYLGQFEN
jgi:hypothetical protein